MVGPEVYPGSCCDRELHTPLACFFFFNPFSPWHSTHTQRSHWKNRGNWSNTHWVFHGSLKNYMFHSGTSHCFSKLARSDSLGLPWWYSGYETACQCRGHGFEPWSGKIPHAVEQLSPCATTTEPVRLEPVLRNKRSHRDEKPTHCNEE